MSIYVYHLAACGGSFVGSEGQIQSPNYPNAYSGADCGYRIQVPEGKTVLLTFTAFELEPGATCTDDYVEVKSLPLLLGFKHWSQISTF